MRPRLAALLAVAATAACRGPLVVGESSGSSRSTREGDVVRTVDNPCPDATRARVYRNECWPTAHVGRWRGIVTGDPYYHFGSSARLDYPSGDLLLVVLSDGSGTLRFEAPREPPPDGDSRPRGQTRDAAAANDAGTPKDAGEAGAADDLPDATAAADAAAGGAKATAPSSELRIVEGFEYRLRELSGAGGPADARHLDPLLSFSFDLAQPFYARCEALAASCSAADSGPGPAIVESGSSAPPICSLAAEPRDLPCRCTADGCEAVPHEVSVSLSLSADIQAMRGQARSASPNGETAVALLELLRS